MQYKSLIASILLALLSSHSQFLNAQEIEIDQGQKLQEVFNLIRFLYVDTVDENHLATEAIVKMLEELDPHSVYIPPKNVARAEETIQGNFEGVGIQFNIYKDTIMVVNPIQGGPSAKLGIRAGDRIVTIDDSLVAGTGITNMDVIKLLRGKKGTVVQVGIHRSGTSELLDYSITRDQIPLYSIDAQYMIDKNTGYIKINSFSATTVEEFDNAIHSLKKEGLQNLILDLTFNGGGLMKASTELADRFLDNDKLIVFTKDRLERKQEFKSSKKGNFEEGKLIILINDESASASEIVSGAIQDHDRGIIIGRRSFGKGLVQRPFPIPDGSLIRMTIARYYTPSGRCIQKPYDKGSDKYHFEQFDRYQKGELFSADSIKIDSNLLYHTEKGRPVYGGGGIMPDIFVPLDTSWYTATYGRINRKGVLYSFVIDYFDKNRMQFEKDFPHFKNFEKSFEVNDEIMEEFRTFCAGKNLEFQWQELSASKSILSTRIKALIARSLFDSSAYYKIVNDLEPIYLKALETIKKDFKI